ncbi:MAG TPA: M56 family metallopeptidase [Bacteroidales bacterium]|nr:M56 family metallopeptidase [Bacteroidales bacterium]
MKFLLYQLEAGALLCIFFLIYHWVIRGSTLFAYKRLYVLASLILSFVVPFLKISVPRSEIGTYYQLLPQVVVGAGTSATASEADYPFWISLIVISVSAGFLYITINKLYALLSLIKTSSIERYKQYRIVETDGNEAFSFFGYIFLGKGIAPEHRATILRHELIHANRIHSFDLVLVNLCLLIQWFNPFLWMFRTILKANHEYEADSIMLNEGVAVSDYQQLLLNQMFQTRGVQFSSFNYNSFIKNRIQMMTKRSAAGKTRFLLATIFSFIVVTAFAFRAEEVTKRVPVFIPKVDVKNKIVVVSQDTTKKEKPFIVVDEPAKFQGKGLEAFNAYIIANVKYPAEAIKAKMKGKVYAQFEVNKKGEVVNVRILRSCGYPILDEEAVRVLKSSPLWSPAKHKGLFVGQLFTMPVVFALVK